MKTLSAVVFLFLASVLVGVENTEHWREINWRGERAFAASSRGREAVVSVDRARLVYFGPEHEAQNLLFLPESLKNPAGWGGHRVWLGPQTDWKKNWPPPAAWDSRPAENVAVNGPRLELAMGDAGEGWPRLARIYFWEEGKLHCVARMSGGTRAAQVIHIVQVPAGAEVELAAAPTSDIPRGYVQVHLGRGLVPVKQFPAPPQISEASGKLRLKFTGKMDKFGFAPQSILAHLADDEMTIARGAITGAPASTPDEGFVTQIYVGSANGPVIELEQLSPLFPAGSVASFEIVISSPVASREN